MATNNSGRRKYLRLHLLPARDIHDGQRTIRLSDSSYRSEVFASIRRNVRLFKPSLLLEHNLEGQSYGYIDQVYATDEGLFARAVIQDPDTQEQIKGWGLVDFAQKFRFVSPRIVWNGRDDKGMIQPARLLEVSLTHVPRFAIGQQEIAEEDDSKVGMDDSASDGIGEYVTAMSFDKSGQLVNDKEGVSIMTTKGAKVSTLADDLDETDAGVEVIDSAEEVEADIEVLDRDTVQTIIQEALESLVPALAEQVKGLVLGELAGPQEAAESETEASEEPSAAPEEDEEEEAVETAASEDEDSKEEESEMSVLKRENQLLKAEIQVREDLITRPHLSTMSEKLVRIYVEAPGVYEDVLEVAGGARASTGAASNAGTSIMSQRVSPTARAAARVNQDAVERALNISREQGITFAEAYRQAGE